MTDAPVTFTNLIALSAIWLSAVGALATAVHHSARARLDRHGHRIEALTSEVHELTLHVVKQNGRIAILEKGDET